MKSKRKGSRIERGVVTEFQMVGIHAERVPLSGAVGGSFAGDILIEGTYRAEVKARVWRWFHDDRALEGRQRCIIPET